MPAPSSASACWHSRSVPVLSALGATVAPGTLLALCVRRAAGAAPTDGAGVPDAHAACIALGAAGARRRAGCIVLLPGAYHALEDFIDAGFDQALRERAAGGGTDAGRPGAGAPERSRLARAAARPRSCARTRADGRRALARRHLARRIHGVALRGGSIRCSIDGLCLLAPYLGSRIVAADIAAHASLRDWQPPALWPMTTTSGASGATCSGLRRYAARRAVPRLWPRGSLCRYAAAAGARTAGGLQPRDSPAAMTGRCGARLWDNFLERSDTC